MAFFTAAMKTCFSWLRPETEIILAECQSWWAEQFVRRNTTQHFNVIINSEDNEDISPHSSLYLHLKTTIMLLRNWNLGLGSQYLFNISLNVSSSWFDMALIFSFSLIISSSSSSILRWSLLMFISAYSDFASVSFSLLLIILICSWKC